ncbi:MAG: hypothetical protein A2046_07690 [Bacteroidetes bacterium GWA2_30_7]|nr:MAG: hypothetical protein A2046_07690 [Bacteroidetes bacterium GWA2_30_7]
MISFDSNIFSQIKVKNGPALTNDEDNKMNRMLGGDESGYYCYRVRSRGKGTSFYVEKYKNESLKPEFSKEITVDDAEGTKIIDVKYSNDVVFIFRSQYDKDLDKMELSYQTVSSSGVVSKDLKPITKVKTDHFEFVEFEIETNPSNTKILVKSSFKENKDAEYKTDFIAFSVPEMKELWKKTVNRKLRSYNSDFGKALLGQLTGINFDFDQPGYVGLFFDDNDNLFYGYTVENAKSNDKEKHYKLNLETLDADSDEPESLELSFEEDYYVKDIAFLKTKDNKLYVGGFYKDVIERKGRDLVNCGIFNFTVDIATNKIESKTVKVFDDKFLKALESNNKKSRRFKYKLDYILAVGKDIYYIGEQYAEYTVQVGSQYSRHTEWQYEYMDVIVAKMNSLDEFEWINNAPVRVTMMLRSPHVFKQYISYATDNNIYILYNEHPKNMAIYQKPDYEPKDLKSTISIHGSNFVYTSFSIIDGKINRGLIFKNETYCFAPIQEKNPQFFPPADTENFVVSGKDEIIIYTEDRGKDRFSKLTLD